jgi:hypothetical protein
MLIDRILMGLIGQKKVSNRTGFRRCFNKISHKCPAIHKNEVLYSIF